MIKYHFNNEIGFYPIGWVCNNCGSIISKRDYDSISESYWYEFIDRHYCELCKDWAMKEYGMDGDKCDDCENCDCKKGNE